MKKSFLLLTACLAGGVFAQDAFKDSRLFYLNSENGTDAAFAVGNPKGNFLAKGKKPEIVVVTLGINGISYMYNQKEYFISVYTKLVRQIQDASPETKIILQSVFPVATNWEKESINNEKINLANAWVRSVDAETGVSYLDTISVLAVADGGYLPLEYQNGDGLHLNPTALGIVLNYIRTHALPGYADPIYTTE